jgi:hypothetical protein
MKHMSALFFRSLGILCATGLFMYIAATSCVAAQENAPLDSLAFDQKVEALRASSSPAPELLEELSRLQADKPQDAPGASKYRRSGHQYTTYIVASLAGLGPERAHILSYFSQYPDDEVRFSATMAFIYFWDTAYRKQIMAVLHSLHGGDRQAVLHRRSALKALIADNTSEDNRLLSDPQLGLVIHAFADSYAHVKGKGENLKAFNYTVGHLFHGHEPDIIAFDGERYKEFACNLFQALTATPDADCAGPLQDLFVLISNLSASGEDELPKFERYAATLSFDPDLYKDAGGRLAEKFGKQDVVVTIETMKTTIR